MQQFCDKEITFSVPLTYIIQSRITNPQELYYRKTASEYFRVLSLYNLKITIKLQTFFRQNSNISSNKPPQTLAYMLKTHTTLTKKPEIWLEKLVYYLIISYSPNPQTLILKIWKYVTLRQIDFPKHKQSYNFFPNIISQLFSGVFLFNILAAFLSTLVFVYCFT